MTANPVTANVHTTLPEAHKLMTGKKIRRLLVLDGDKLVGIVTRGDIRGAEPSEATSLSIYELNYLLAKLTLDKIMHRDPLTVSPETTIREAARLMLQNKIAGLPVVDGGKLVGIITESDIFRLVVKTWDNEDKKG
ncbi:MAG: CBS domain-containing protein [Chloroflexi bacterium]|nr:CBS domain-containing protein [Chloroflexota bacterium]